MRPSSLKLIWATIGRSGARSRAARIAASISSRRAIVSSMRRSTPPSTSASDLLGVDGAQVCSAVSGIEALQRIAERSDRAGDQGISPDRLDGPAGDLHRRPG